MSLQAGNLSTYEQFRWLHSSGRIKKQFTSKKTLHKLNDGVFPSAMRTTLWCLGNDTYSAFLSDKFTFCLSLMTFKEPLYVPKFAIWVCLQSTEVGISAQVVYICDDLGIVFYCTLDVNDTAYMYSSICESICYMLYVSHITQTVRYELIY